MCLLTFTLFYGTIVRINYKRMWGFVMKDIKVKPSEDIIKIEQVKADIDERERKLKEELKKDLRVLLEVGGPLALATIGYFVFKTPMSFVVGAAGSVVNFLVDKYFIEIKDYWREAKEKGYPTDTKGYLKAITNDTKEVVRYRFNEKSRNVQKNIVNTFFEVPTEEKGYSRTRTINRK